MDGVHASIVRRRQVAANAGGGQEGPEEARVVGALGGPVRQGVAVGAAVGQDSHPLRLLSGLGLDLPDDLAQHLELRERPGLDDGRQSRQQLRVGGAVGLPHQLPHLLAGDLLHGLRGNERDGDPPR